jgi:hypothetical protein
MEVPPSSVPFPFDALPSVVRESVFLLLRPTDLLSCLRVSTAWRDFIAATIMRNKDTRGAAATFRRVFGKIVGRSEMDVDSMWLLVRGRFEKCLTMSEGFSVARFGSRNLQLCHLLTLSASAIFRLITWHCRG